MALPTLLEAPVWEKEIRDIILVSTVELLEAQVRALKKLRGSNKVDKSHKKSMSQSGIVFSILTEAGRPRGTRLRVMDIPGYAVARPSEKGKQTRTGTIQYKLLTIPPYNQGGNH